MSERPADAMRWTREPPPVAGWYWIEATTAAGDVFRYIGQCRAGEREYLNVRVAGPIPEPLEPEGDEKGGGR